MHVLCQIYLFNLYSAFQMQTTDTQALGTSSFCYFQKCILDVYVDNMFFKEFFLKKNKKGLSGLKTCFR